MRWDRVSVVTGPQALPVSVDTVRSWSRIDTDCDDLLLRDLIKGAVAQVDGPSGIGYALLEQTWRLSLDAFPDSYRQTVYLPGAPVKSVTSVNYIDVDGTAQAVPAEDYTLDLLSDTVRLEPAFAESWPATRDQSGAVWIDYVVGESTAQNIPRDLIEALLLQIGHRYENRETVSAVQLTPIPMGVESILNRYRRSYVT